MVDYFMIGARRVYLRAERLGAAFQHLVEVGPHRRTGVGPIPYFSRAGNNSLSGSLRSMIGAFCFREQGVNPTDDLAERLPEKR